MYKRNDTSDSRPTLELRPSVLVHGDTLQIAGAGWPLDAIVITFGRQERAPDRVLAGSLYDGLLVPSGDGTFLVEYSTGTLAPGSIAIRASVRGTKLAGETKLELRERVKPGPKVPRAEIDKPAIRGLAFKRERARDGGWPKGATLAMREDWIRKYPPKRGNRGDGAVFFSLPVPGGCNWVPLGPSPFTHGKGARAANNTGRTRCIAVDPATPTLIYIGTASGGVWRSTDGGASWLPKTDDKFSLAIGAIAVDPVSRNVVYAGTGEYVPGSDYGHYYGRGLLRSTDFGDSWTELGVVEFDMAEIARIVVNPLDPANLFVAASNGLWESTSSGAAWTQLSASGCTDVVLVQNPMEPGTRRLVAAFAFLGVRASANSGAGWSAFADVTVPGAPAGSRRVVFGVCRTMPSMMYAAFCAGGAGGSDLAHVARSDDWGQTWTPKTIPGGGAAIYSANYCMAIMPHPSAPDTVILGTVELHKSIDGGSTWTPASGGTGHRVHADIQALVWHPTDANRVFVACDGGFFVSPDVAASWEARNLDVGAIQCYDFGQHPAYEAIMIAGSQDNGGFHYSGAPIWKGHWVHPGVSHNRMGGDATTAQIDPFDGSIHYYGTGVVRTIRRSDDAGRFFTTSWSYFPGTEWWAPFHCHPLTAGVVFTGGHRLWRSDARGDAGTWTDITADLPSPVRSIGFHPANARVLYAGTTGGQVYRLTGPPAGAWNSGTVTTEDVTLTGLPANIGISSIAVDASGNVWVTSSDLVHTEATGEFTNDHVFRLDAGATAWVSKSAGLVNANPINSIVLDPLDTTRAYCGGDRGVFAWNPMTATWSAIDQGLANAPVIKLLIHAPSRKLRAATHGRGVWERPLDPIGCTDTFLYLRDHVADAGRTPSPDHVPHPYVAGEFVRHWQSVDIVVDPVAQTPALVTSPMELYDNVVHLGGRRGANRIYVTLHNKGPFAVNNARVRAFFAPASMGLAPLPAGLLADPFGWNPAGTSVWTPISIAAANVGRIEPGTTRLASWNFTIPMSAPRHSCLLAFITSDEDPFATGGITNPDELVVNNRKVALRNLDLEAMPGSGGAGGVEGGSGLPPGFVARELQMYGSDTAQAVLLASNLPEDAIVVAFGPKKFRSAETKVPKRAEKARDTLLRECRDALRGYDADRPILREVERGAEIVLGETKLERGKPARLFVAVHSAKWDREQIYTFDVMQVSNGRITGGYTVQLADLARMTNAGTQRGDEGRPAAGRS